MKNRTTALVVFLLAMFLPLVAHAQTASITGTVTDSSGALVPHAKVSATRESTNASRTAETGETGAYRITNLTPDVYDVNIEKAGFKIVLYSKVQLTVDQVLTLDARLDPSGVTEVVNVNGQSLPPIDLNDAQVGNIVDNRQMSDLPLSLRDPYQLVLLSPGVIQSNSLLGGFAVNGSRERNNNFLLDGTDNNDAEIPGFPRGLGGPVMGSLNPDMAQEFRVITNNYLPEFGRNTGAVVDVITRGGTKTLHGDVYWFGRYDALGARGFFNHVVNSATGQLEPKNPYVRNDFGASAGGPIIQDKTFWFANYEGQRFATTITNNAIVPTPEFKSGKFTFDGQLIDVTSSTSPNNVSGLSPDQTIKNILAKYPPPNGPKVDDVRGQLFFPSKSLVTADNVTGRVDHYFTAKEVFSARYTFNRFDDNNTNNTDFLPGLGSTGTRARTQNLSLRLTSTLGRTFTNDLRFGGNRINFPLTCGGTSVMNAVGATDQFGRGLDYPLPGISGFGCLLLGDSSGSKRFSGTYTAGDSVALLRGRHSVKTGFEFRDVYSNSLNDFLSRTTVDFHNFSNFGAPAFATGVRGIDNDPLLQDMVWSLFGAPGIQNQAQYFNQTGGRTPDDLRGFRQREFNVFGQDSYQLRPNLTVSYGLRYQFNGVPFEVNNQLSTLLADPSGAPPLQCPSVLFGSIPCFAFTVVGEGGGRPSLYKNDWKDFEPRIGVAWDPFKRGKTSLRAGYGIFHDRVYGQLIGLARGNPPFQEIVSNTFNPLTGFPPLLPPATVPSSPAVPDGALNFPFLIDRNLRMPYSQNWNVGIQHEYFRNLLFEVNYVGSKGTRLLRLLDPNPPQPGLASALEAFCVPGNPANTGFNTPANPAFNTQAGQCSQATPQFSSLYFGFQAPGSPGNVLPFNAVNNNAFFHGNLFTGIANSTYHSLQANITRRLSHGLALQGAYTWSHAIDDASDPLVASAGNLTFPRNTFDLHAERGNSDFDVTHRLVLNYTWDLPVGRGHDHLGEGFVGKVLEGWQLGGITMFSSGLPYDIFTPIDSAHTGQAARPDFNAGAIPAPSTDPGTQTGPSLSFFSLPQFGSAGNLGRNRFRGPGINNWDTVLSKATRLNERFALDMRFEFYNLFNRTQFNQPDNLIQDLKTFGHSTAEVTRPDGTTGARQVQLAMKLHF